MAVEDTLAKVELFSELPRRDLARVAKGTIVRQFKKGDVIVREGDLGVAFYVIGKGRVEVVKGLSDGRGQVIAKLGPDDFFGEMSLFDNQVRSHSVRATEDTECVILTKWDFNAELTAPGGRIATAMLAILARRLRSVSEAPTH